MLSLLTVIQRVLCDLFTCACFSSKVTQNNLCMIVIGDGDPGQDMTGGDPRAWRQP